MQIQEPVKILASQGVVMIRIILDFAMCMMNKARIIYVRVMSPAMRGMTAVQMQKDFVNVSECHLHIISCTQVFIIKMLNV